MRLIVISPEIFVRDESQTVNKLFDCGLETLHIRKPNANIQSLRSYVKCIDPSFHPRLIVHGCYDLLQEFNLAGIHLKAYELEALKDRDRVISSSAHSEAEFRAMDRPWMQIFISPVFDSVSKTGYRGTPHLLETGSIIRYGQLIALGGISEKNIKLVKRKGFDGAAILGYIWQAADPVSNYLYLKQLIAD